MILSTFSHFIVYFFVHIVIFLTGYDFGIVRIYWYREEDKMKSAFVQRKRPSNSRGNLHLILFSGLFFFSILFANLRCPDAVFWLGYQTENSLMLLDPGEFSWRMFALFFLKYRLLPWLLPAFLGYFPKSSLLLPAYSGWLGGIFGFFATTLIRQFGLASLPLTAAILLPQIIFYALAYLLLIHNKLRRCRAYLIKILILTGIWLSGVLCEYAVNPWLLEKAYGLFRHIL